MTIYMRPYPCPSLISLWSCIWNFPKPWPVTHLVSFTLFTLSLSWDGILRHQFNKILESFAPCYSQYLLLADFSENHILLMYHPLADLLISSTLGCAKKNASTWQSQGFKKVLIWPKQFFFATIEYGYKNNSDFYADFKTVEENAKNLLTKSYKQKKGAKLVFALFYITNLPMFWANNFFWVHFFPITSTDLKLAKNSAFFLYSYF